MSILRDYQRQAITAAWDTISPEVNRVAIEMAMVKVQRGATSKAVDVIIAFSGEMK